MSENETVRPCGCQYWEERQSTPVICLFHLAQQDRIEELERQVAMWTDVHDADSLRLSELERALADIENYYAQHYREGEVGYQAVLIARDVKRIRP